MVHLPSPHVLAQGEEWFFHSNCQHNILSALNGRVALCVPHPKPDQVFKLLKLSTLLGRSLGLVSPIEDVQVISMYSGFRRRRYQEAKKTLDFLGPHIDSRLKMFVKMEGIKYKTGKVNPACRAIQFRESTFQLQIARYIKPMEHRLYRATGPKPFPTTQFIAKNLNPSARARLMLEKYEGLPGCEMLELDASRFDAHVTPDLILIEQECYKQMSSDPFFLKLLKAKRKNKGRCRTGDTYFSYSLNGGRMSGDMDTASSNCILMSCMLTLFGMERTTKFDFLVDGDDSVFFYTGPRVDSEDVYDFFLKMGMQMKIENRTHNVYNLGFCQSRIVQLRSGPTLIRDPLKAMSKITINYKFNDARSIPNLIEVICLGELSLCSGCPVVSPYFLRLLEIARSMKVKDRNPYFKNFDWVGYRLSNNLSGDWWKLKVSPITPQARKSFSEAWGWSVDEQLSFERKLAFLHPDWASAPSREQGIDVGRWLPPAFTHESMPLTFGSQWTLGC